MDTYTILLLIMMAAALAFWFWYHARTQGFALVLAKVVVWNGAWILAVAVLNVIWKNDIPLWGAALATALSIGVMGAIGPRLFFFVYSITSRVKTRIWLSLLRRKQGIRRV